MTDAEAAWVLRQLLARHPGLRSEALGLARAQLVAVERDDVAEAVRDAIDAVSLDDIWARSGAHRDGYVDEGEAAWEAFEEAFAPFADEVVRLIELGETEAAQATLEGVLVALYELPGDPGNDSALSRAEDFPAQAAARLLQRWRAVGGGPLDDALLRRIVPGWATSLTRKPRG